MKKFGFTLATKLHTRGMVRKFHSLQGASEKDQINQSFSV